MAQQTNILKISLDGTGTEIPTLNISTGYDSYLITGTAISTGNYAIVSTGTPQLGDKFVFEYNATLDITTNGNTFSIFGVSITQQQLLKKWIATIIYNGSSWDVTLQMNLSQSEVLITSNYTDSSVTTAKINDAAVTTAKINNLAVTTGKINDLAVTTAKIDDLAVTTAKLAADSVTTAKIVNANVTNDKLANADAYSVIGNNTGVSATPQYILMSTIINSNAWSLTGNSGTVAGTNFIGTTDAVDLVFKVNNTESGRINDSLDNTSFGFTSLQNLTTGNNNSAFGDGALISLTSGVANCSFGSSSLANITTSNYNTAIGTSSQQLSTSGNNNTSIGYGAMYNLLAGTKNTCIGALSGYNVNGDNNTLIGYNSSTSITGANNRIALGYNAEADLDYQFALPDNVEHFKFRGNSYELPSADGDANAVLQTDGAGVLSFGKVVDSGTYTPILTDVTNVNSSTAYPCQYMRVGNTVTVSGKVDIDPTAAAATATELGVSLPIASNFANEYECGGTAASDVASTTTIKILADSVNNRASFKFLAGTTSNDSYSFSFTYQII